MPHNINFREKRSKVRKERRADGGEDGVVVKSRVARFRYFEDISGYSGVRPGFLPRRFTRCINSGKVFVPAYLMLMFIMPRREVM
jgi:hypothetical protein